MGVVRAAGVRNQVRHLGVSDDLRLLVELEHLLLDLEQAEKALALLQLAALILSRLEAFVYRMMERGALNPNDAQQRAAETESKEKHLAIAFLCGLNKERDQGQGRAHPIPLWPDPARQP